MITEAWHKAQYEAVLKYAGRTDAPAWESLTEEQRVAIRESNESYLREMNRLGVEIAAGNKRPQMHLPRGVDEPCGDCDPKYGCTMNCSGPVIPLSYPVEPPPKRGKRK